MRVLLLVAGLCVCGPILGAASSFKRTAGASVDSAAGSFATPAVAVKPRFRYWIPDASIKPEALADDIAQLAGIGAGGVEIHNYFGTPTGKPPTNWTLYGYGTEAYVKVVKAALEAHIDNGLVMDYAMSNNGAVPAATDDPGLTWELAPKRTLFNDTFNGTLPGWKAEKFYAAYVFAVTNVERVTDVSLGPFPPGSPWSKYTISNASIEEVTDLVNADGTISFEPTDPVDDALYYFIQAWYQNQPLVGEIIAANDDPQSILEGGSLYVDHFSAAGGKVITDFLEKYVLVDGVRELLQKVGHYMWEDSVEINNAITFWTPGLDKIFEKQHGVPSSTHRGLGRLPGGLPRVQFLTDVGDGGAGFVADFRATLTSLLMVYYKHIIDWSHEYLGMEFSGQIGWNLPVDMLQAVAVADAPETETLSFDNYLDGFLQYSGAADLSGKQIISIELGADYLSSFSQTWQRLLFDAKHAFAGGVNQVVIHGATYSHNFTGTTWPGYTTHKYDYPEHSRHQPGWGVGYPEALGYLARVQWVLQSGVPKVDIVFWDKQSAQNAFPSPLYAPLDLVEAGYTYEYLSPANFALKEACVENAIFAPARQAFKLLVLRGNDTLTPEGVEYLAKYAKAGLPVIISGPLPSAYATANTAAIAVADKILASILDLVNVHHVPYEDLAAEVASVGITPRSQIQSNGTWYTRWRETSDGDYVFIYNDGNYSTGNITFDSRGAPVSLNAWTGEEMPIVEYSRGSDGRTTIAFTLQPTETRIIKFANSEPLETYVVASSEAVLGFKVGKGSHIQAQVAASKGSTVSLSSGKTIEVGKVGAKPAFRLENWNLTVEKWLPPDDITNLDLDAKKVNQTVDVTGNSLLSWYDLGLTEVCGIGYYTVNFEWHPTRCNKKKSGAYLVVPLISHGIVGSLNGNPLPTFDITNPQLDVSPYLISGTNSLELKVSSTLWNGLSPYWDEIRTAGGRPSHKFEDLEPLQHYGIIGEVKIVPYELVNIA